MKRFRRKLIASLAALTLWAASVASVATAQSPSLPIAHQRYVMIDLTPAGATGARAAATSVTQQVGSADLPTAAVVTESHAMLWSGSADSVDLGSGSAYAVADGQQVGTAGNHAALWSGSAASLIDLNPALWTQSTAFGVANRQQVGVANRQQACVEKRGACGGGGGTFIVIHPMMWSGSAASAIDLTPFNLGYGAGTALATDGLQQVGYGQRVIGANAFSGPFAVMWSGAADTAVDLNPVGSIESQARAVSNGEQVGYAYYPHHAVRWHGNAAAVDLHPAAYYASEANGTNGIQQVGFGQAVTSPQLPITMHALVWSGSADSAIDLNQFLPLGFTEAAATGIDSAGNIVGWASKGPSGVAANVHAVLWKPIDSRATSVQSITPATTPISANDGIVVTVSLDQPAPAGGARVNLGNTVVSPVVPTPALAVVMPANITINEGETAGSFMLLVNAITNFPAPYGIAVQAAFGDQTQTTVVEISQPLFLSALRVAPGNVTSGTNAVGTVTLNGPAPLGGAVVSLSSNNAAATVPANVVVPQGLSSATFNVSTNPVNTFTNVTITGAYGTVAPAVVAAALVVAPLPRAVDTVSISKAEYVASKKQLTVQANSTSQTVVLTVTVTATGQVIGILTNKGAGAYAGTFTPPTNPQSITVTSDLSGSATRAVTLK